MDCTILTLQHCASFTVYFHSFHCNLLFNVLIENACLICQHISYTVLQWSGQQSHFLESTNSSSYFPFKTRFCIVWVLYSLGVQDILSRSRKAVRSLVLWPICQWDKKNKNEVPALKVKNKERLLISCHVISLHWTLLVKDILLMVY